MRSLSPLSWLPTPLVAMNGEGRYRNGVLYFSAFAIVAWIFVGLWFGMADPAVVSARLRLENSDLTPSAVRKRSKGDAEREILEYIVLAIHVSSRTTLTIDIPRSDILDRSDVRAVARGRFSSLGWNIECRDIDTGYRLMFTSKGGWGGEGDS